MKNISFRNSKKYPILNKWIHKIEIDSAQAEKTVQNEYLKNVKTGDINALGKKISALGAIARIKSGEIYITVNKTNFRLDSNITNLQKNILRHITINNNHFNEMDISNSQPFFSACLFDPTIEIEGLIRKYLGNKFIMRVKALHLIKCEDVKQYMSLVINGNFYEHMIKIFEQNNIPCNTRPDAKEQMFVVFFGKINAYKYNKGAKLFKQEFPNVQKLFDMIKKKNNNRLAILLQRIESFVILEKVAQKISNELPNVPFLTKHDSILPVRLFVGNSSYTDKIAKIILNTIYEVTGFFPQGRIKRLI